MKGSTVLWGLEPDSFGSILVPEDWYNSVCTGTDALKTQTHLLMQALSFALGDRKSLAQWRASRRTNPVIRVVEDRVRMVHSSLDRLENVAQEFSRTLQSYAQRIATLSRLESENANISGKLHTLSSTVLVGPQGIYFLGGAFMYSLKLFEGDFIEHVVLAPWYGKKNKYLKVRSETAEHLWGLFSATEGAINNLSLRLAFQDGLDKEAE